MYAVRINEAWKASAVKPQRTYFSPNDQTPQWLTGALQVTDNIQKRLIMFIFFKWLNLLDTFQKLQIWYFSHAKWGTQPKLPKVIYHTTSSEHQVAPAAVTSVPGHENRHSQVSLPSALLMETLFNHRAYISTGVLNPMLPSPGCDLP